MSRASSSVRKIDRMALLLCALGLLAGVVCYLTGRMWIEFCYRLILEGLWTVAWLLAAAGLGAAILKIAGIRSSSRALIFATSAGLGLGIISFVTLLLGLGGWLDHVSAIGILAAGWIAEAWRVAADCSPAAAENSSSRAWRWLWLLIVPMLAAVMVGVFTLPGLLWTDEPAGYDVMEYHLQVPREWYELGRVAPLEHNVFSYFPFNVEMHYLLAMWLRGGPWAGMYLAQMMHAVFVGLGVVAVYGAVRERASPQAAMVSAIMAASVPWLAMLAPIAYDEGGLILFGTLAAAWSIRGINSAYQLKVIALAGAMAGFACGSKLTAVPMVLLVFPVAAAIMRCWPVKACAIFVLVGLLAYSPWLIRNKAWAGNPVFPEAMSLLGSGHFTPEQVDRWSRAHLPNIDHHGLAGRGAALWQQIIADWRYGFVLLPLGCVAMLLTWRRAESRLLGGILFLQLAIWIGFTHLQGRFFVMAIPLAAMLIGHVQLRGWFVTMTCAATIALCVGWINIDRRVHLVPPAQGIEDYRPIMRASLLPAGVASQIFDTNLPVVLVGDAQAFLYQIPMTRLRYRTVFDVRPAKSLLEGWIGEDAPRDALVVVNPNELKRLWTFYPPLPPFPMEMAGQNQPFILDNHLQR